MLDNGSRDEGREFQKAQAMWAAGKMDDDAYLAAYAKYVGKLDGTAKINAQQSLDRERYTFARNDIVARIDAGDESAWNQLLAYDRASLSGLATDNEEYQRRLSYMRSTQNSIFSAKYSEITQKVQNGQMTTRQLYSWLQQQRSSGLTSGNGALARDISQRIEATKVALANEQREKVYSKYADGKMSPSEFINYARTQRNQFRKGTSQYAQWNGRASAARLAMQDSRMGYRWGLSEQYHSNQQKLQQPPPGQKGAATRTIYSDGVWTDVPVDVPPTPAQAESYANYQKEQELLKAEQKAIERRLSNAGMDFVEPSQMVKFYRKRQKGVVKGTSEWLALQDQIDQFRDAGATWDMFNTDTGFFPTKVGSKFMSKTAGRKIPGEEQITVNSFMRALGSQYGGGKQQKRLGVHNRYGINNEEWKAWAGEYLGDASAKQTPDNLKNVTRARLEDLHRKYGSWAMVGHAWMNGANEDASISAWDGESKKFVSSLWRDMGMGPLPKEWTFKAPKPAAATGEGAVPPADAIQQIDGRPEAPRLYAFDQEGEVPQGGERRLQKTAGLEGMGTGEFDHMYKAARSAFLNGETSFMHNGTNYSFPADLAARARVMGEMDFARTELKYKDWKEAEAVVAARGTAATAEDIDRADDKRMQHVGAFDTAGQNAIDMLFMQQKEGSYDPKTGVDKAVEGPGIFNYNPGADAQRIGELTKAGVQAHIDAGDEWFASGHKTQAIIEYGLASQMAKSATPHLQQLDAMVQEATKMVQERGTNVTEEQSDDIEAIVDFKDTYGITDLEANIQTQRDEVLKWVQLDEGGNIMWAKDGENVVDRAGTVNVLKHNEGGGEDTIVPMYLDKSVQPGQDIGTLEEASILEGHLRGAVTIKGDTIIAQLPYEEDVIGIILTDDGGQVPIKGKKISTNINGLHQTSIENPFLPGTFQTVDADTDQPLGMIFKAPEGMSSEVDQFGNQRISWDDPTQDRVLSLSWDPNNAAYTIFEQLPDPWFGDAPPPKELGNLGNNPDLAAQIFETFPRDLSGVPKMAIPAQQQFGVHIGMSAEQYGNQMQVEADAAKRQMEADKQRRAYSEKQIQALPAQNQAEARKIAAMMTPVTPTTTISDDMRSVSSSLSQPIEKPVAGVRPAPAPTVRQPEPSEGTPIDATPRDPIDLSRFAQVRPTTIAAPIRPTGTKPKIATPKTTPTTAPRRPAQPRGPLKL